MQACGRCIKSSPSTACAERARPSRPGGLYQITLTRDWSQSSAHRTSAGAQARGVQIKTSAPRCNIPSSGMNESVISLRLTLPSISSKEKPMVIEISSSSSEEEAQKNEREGEKRGRKRRYPDVEMKTKEEKRREDEDCCILPFDPFAADLNEKLSVSAAQSQLDDLTIVAERGQVACRDFPHSRHLCAEYPFSKTPHESCCLKCYCYVCDEAAPCKCWKGPKGHCHASDQDESWKTMRKFRRITRSHKVKTHF